MVGEREKKKKHFIQNFSVGETTKARVFTVSPSVTEGFYLKKTVTGYSITMLPRTYFHAFVHGKQNMFSDLTL